MIIAGPWALAYIALYILATVPGWPLGRALFGRHHPAGFITGALLGYGLTCLAFWGVLALAFGVSRHLRARMGGRHRHHMDARHVARPALVPLPAWSPPDVRTFVLLLAIVPAVFVFPYKNLGAQDAQGNRFYRAYFTADFIWHTALTAELMKYDMPPINPYLGDRTIQYYWTYFLVPAVIAEEGPAGLRDVELVLKVNALSSGVLFLAALILATWSASRSTVGTAIAIVLGVLAVSAEGLYMAWDSQRARPFADLSQVLQHRRDHRMEIQWAAGGQPRAIHVVQPSSLDVRGAGIARHAGGRRRRSGGAAWCDRPRRARAGALHDVQSPDRRPVLADVWGRHSCRLAARASVARSPASRDCGNARASLR